MHRELIHSALRPQHSTLSSFSPCPFPPDRVRLSYQDRENQRKEPVMHTILRRTFLKYIGMLSAAPFLRPLSVFAVQPEATRILINGKIITMDGSDSIAEAIALSGDRILESAPLRRSNPSLDVIRS